MNNVVKIQITIVMYFKEMEFKQYSTKLQVKHEHIYSSPATRKYGWLLTSSQCIIPDLLSQNWREGSLLDQQSLSQLHTLLALRQQNQTSPICKAKVPKSRKKKIQDQETKLCQTSSYSQKKLGSYCKNNWIEDQRKLGKGYWIYYMGVWDMLLTFGVGGELP